MSPYKDPEIRREKQKIYQKRWYEKNKEKRIEETKQRKLKFRKRFKEYKKTLSCELCGEDRWYCLVFHHRNPKEKEKTITQMVHHTPAWETIIKEINKCQVLCRNCHAEVEYLGNEDSPSSGFDSH